MQKDVTYTVTEQETGQKIETILKQGLSLTKNQIKSAKFRPDGICVNGNRARISTVVFSGDVVSVQLETKETASGHVEAVPGNVEILYEDEDLVLVNKPAGLVVHPAHGHYDDTLANHLMYYFEQHGLRVCIRAVGRLDKDTSGIVLFAKNKSWIREGRIRSEYIWRLLVILLLGILFMERGGLIPEGKWPGRRSIALIFVCASRLQVR